MMLLGSHATLQTQVYIASTVGRTNRGASFVPYHSVTLSVYLQKTYISVDHMNIHIYIRLTCVLLPQSLSLFLVRSLSNGTYFLSREPENVPTIEPPSQEHAKNESQHDHRSPL